MASGRECPRTNDRVPERKAGQDAIESGSDMEALGAGGGLVEVGSKVDIATGNADTRLIRVLPARV